MDTYLDVVKRVVWVARSLYDKGYVNGLSGNISFLYEGCIYISKSGSCFGTLDAHSFVNITKEKTEFASKEYPLHKMLYDLKRKGCVIHTHSLYITIFSCEKENKVEELFLYTPYLEMLTNKKTGYVNYAEPGSEKLFANFKVVVERDTDMYVLKNHGVIAWADKIENAFNMICEIEESAKIRAILKNFDKSEFRIREDGEK